MNTRTEKLSYSEKQRMHESLVHTIMKNKFLLGMQARIVLAPVGYDFSFFDKKYVHFDTEDPLPHGGKRLCVRRANLEHVTVSYGYGSNKTSPEYLISPEGRILQERFTALPDASQLCVVVERRKP